jgi:hypothetical protein
VVDSTGVPVSHAGVGVVRSDGRGLRWSTSAVLTGVDGTFVLPNLLPGAYRLASSHPTVKDVATAHATVPPAAEDVTVVTIRLATALAPAPGGK